MPEPLLKQPRKPQDSVEDECTQWALPSWEAKMRLLPHLQMWHLTLDEHFQVT